MTLLELLAVLMVLVIVLSIVFRIVPDMRTKTITARNDHNTTELVNAIQRFMLYGYVFTNVSSVEVIRDQLVSRQCLFPSSKITGNQISMVVYTNGVLVFGNCNVADLEGQDVSLVFSGTYDN